MEPQDFSPLFRKHREEIFGEDHSYFIYDHLSQEELDQIKELRSPMEDVFRLYLGVFDENEKFIGWSWGAQESGMTFCMYNSAVAPDYRRQGIYTSLLQKAIEIIQIKGFQLIYSRHCMTNNEVIIPKLKAGFVISKLELDDMYGALVHLHYHLHPLRRKILDYRSGHLKPDEEIKRVFKI